MKIIITGGLMHKTGKYIGLIIGILVFVVLSSGCVSIDDLVKNMSLNNTGNSTLSAYNVSFNYPSSWYAYIDNKAGNHTIWVSRSSNDPLAPTLQVDIISNPKYMSDQDAVNLIQGGTYPYSLYPYGWTKISNTTIQIEGKTAYEEIFRVNDSHYTELMKNQQISFVKNGNTYILDFQASYNDFDNEKSYFDMMLNSFKVQ